MLPTRPPKALLERRASLHRYWAPQSTTPAKGHALAERYGVLTALTLGALTWINRAVHATCNQFGIWRRNDVRFHSLIPTMLALVLAACASSPDTPSPSTPVARGEATAHRLCASCHAVGKFDKSRHSEAPAFRNLSDNYPVEDLAESLVEGLMTGHPDMPEFQFTPEAADDFIAYLESIQETGVHRVDPGT